MIAKRVAAHKKGEKARAGSLIRYVVDEEHSGAKVAKISVTNCQSEHYHWAIEEIEAIQDMNTRSRADKTYHLVVSFQDDENPADEVLDDIERQMADSLGYGEHQRLSAVHNDTDNLHMHIVINKVHPERFTVHEPYYDHYQLGELCQRLERKHGLQIDSHAQPNKARDSRLIKTEALKEQGITPLNEWLRDKMTTDGTRCWEDLHRQAAHAGISLVVKGNGLAFVHKDSGLGVRASAVSRSLSKANLIKLLGDFEPQKKSYEIRHRYDVDKTLVKRINHADKYWAQYQAQKIKTTENKALQLEQLKLYQAQERQRILEKNKLARAEIKLGRTIVGSWAKKEAYRILAERRQTQLNHLYAHIRALRKNLYEDNKAVSWREFLTQKADAGDKEALKILRKLKPANRKNINVISGEIDSGLIIDDKTRILKESGEVTYRRGKVIIIDAGKNIYFKHGFDQASLTFAIGLAKAKYSELTVNGSDAFKDAVRQQLLENEQTKGLLRQDAIDAFVTKRNNTAGRVNALKTHTRLSASTQGTFRFEGLRRIGDRYVLLCEDKETMGVLEIDKKTFDRFNHIKRGADIALHNGVPTAVRAIKR